MKPVLSVFLMAYDEAGALEQTARELHSELKKLGEPFEFVVIDDGSTDGTSEKADAAAALLPDTRVVHHGANLGLGGVYRTGFAEAKGEFVTFFSADGQFPAEIIGQFRPMMEDFDMVLGYLPGRKGSAVSKALSAMERLLYTVLFGRMPKFQGILMFRRDILDKVELRSTGRGWAVLMELIIRVSRGGYRIKSVPTGFRPRTSGRSKANSLKNIRSNFMQVVSLKRYI